MRLPLQLETLVEFFSKMPGLRQALWEPKEWLSGETLHSCNQLAKLWLLFTLAC